MQTNKQVNGRLLSSRPQSTFENIGSTFILLHFHLPIQMFKEIERPVLEYSRLSTDTDSLSVSVEQSLTVGLSVTDRQLGMGPIHQ